MTKRKMARKTPPAKNHTTPREAPRPAKTLRRSGGLLAAIILITALLVLGLILGNRALANSPTALPPTVNPPPATLSTPATPAGPAAGLTPLPATVSVAEAAALQGGGALILDVRELDEWNAGHIDGARLISLGELPERLSEIPQDVPIVVVCRSGNRSASGRDILLNAGYSAVTSLSGGIKDWIAAGYPVVTAP